VASITNHSCVTSAGFALNVFMSIFRAVVWRPFSTVGVLLGENLLGWAIRRPAIFIAGDSESPSRATGAAGAKDYTKNQGLREGVGPGARRALPSPHVQLPPCLPRRQPRRRPHSTRCLIAILRHLTQKDAAFTVVDTHAGPACTAWTATMPAPSAKPRTGWSNSLPNWRQPAAASRRPGYRPPAAGLPGDGGRFNPAGQLKIYPGSPFIVQALLRKEARDKLKLFELHPTDSKALAPTSRS